MTQADSETAEQGPRRRRDLKSLRALGPFLRPYRLTLMLAFLALSAAAMATLVLPVVARGIVDHGFTKSNLAAVGDYFLLALAACAFLGVASGTRFYFVSWLGERVMADIRRAVYDHLLALSPSFFEVTRTGEVLSRLTTDTTLIQTIVGSSASVALRNLFIVAGGVIMMVKTAPTLSGLTLLGVPAVVVPIVILGRVVRKLSRGNQDKVAGASALASEVLGAVQTVQASTQENYERGRFALAVEQAFDSANHRNVVRAGMTALVISVVAAAIVGILWYGAHLVISGQMSGGLLSQFILYSILVASGLGALSEVWGDLQKAAGAAERLIELLHVEPQVKAPAHPRSFPQPAEGAVAFENVTFCYPLRPGVPALDRFSLAVKPGEVVALVGPSGAGKSTVFQLLLRFYDPNSGSIRLDGVPLAETAPTELRRHIAIVPQDVVLFSGSVADNIRYARPAASEAEVRAAAEAASALEFITALPQGFGTPLGERGATLSGGQRQRIAIARAVLRNAPLLLLDEATSALDSQSELAVQYALERLMHARTTLVIAHRLSTVQSADRIVVMDQGRAVAQGTHAELIRQGGLYARLAALQFQTASGEESASRALGQS
jgi:ATP-binding cassette, subfamily B, bacterial